MIGTEKLSLKQRDGRVGPGRVGSGRVARLFLFPIDRIIRLAIARNNDNR